MAKISARGATKLAQRSEQWTDSDGWDHKLRLAYRSDGKVLKAHDLRSPEQREAYGSRGWDRGGYSIITGIDVPNTAVFHDFADRWFASRPHNFEQ